MNFFCESSLLRFADLGVTLYGDVLVQGNFYGRYISPQSEKDHIYYSFDEDVPFIIFVHLIKLKFVYIL